MGEHRPDVAAAMTSSRGHIGSAGTYLDVHFAAAGPEYAASLRSVGLQAGWRVLDAGCGRGNYLPLIAETVGPGGAVAALDLAPENIAVVDESVATWRLSVPITTHVGSVVALPFPDGSFDAVWCANTLEYLLDADLPTALRELRRVVRPGGTVAIKDSTLAHHLFAPGDPALFARMAAAADPHSAVIHGHQRAPQTRRWMEAAGFGDVRQRTQLVERWAPLTSIEREFVGAFLAGTATLVAELSGGLPLPAEDRAFWERHCDPHASGHVADHPDFYWCEGHIVAVGTVPA